MICPLSIPQERGPNAKLTLSEYNQAVWRMPNNIAVGPDGVPAEVFKYCKEARDALFEIVNRIWDTERLPEGFACANFVILFKNKISSDDLTKYRCIGLLSHTYKTFQQCLLQQLEEETKRYLSDRLTIRISKKERVPGQRTCPSHNIR